MRGLLHAFRDHAGLGHPWKGIWAHPVLAAVGVGDCTVRELLLKTSSPSFFILISGPQGGSAPPVSSPEDSRGTGSVQISGQAHDAIPPAVCTYGVFSTPHDVAHLLLYDRSAT